MLTTRFSIIRIWWGLKRKFLPDDFVPFEGVERTQMLGGMWNHSGEIKAFLQQIASESEEYLRNEYGLSRESIRDVSWSL